MSSGPVPTGIIVGRIDSCRLLPTNQQLVTCKSGESIDYVRQIAPLQHTIMVVSTRLTLKDIYLFNLQMACHTYSLALCVRDAGILFVAAAVWLYFSRHPQFLSEWITLFSTAMYFSAISCIVWFAIAPVLAALAAVGTPELRGVQEFEASDSAFIERNSAGEHITFWKSVLSVKVLKDYAAVQTGKITYHIIPASAFATREFFEAYCRELIFKQESAS